MPFKHVIELMVLQVKLDFFGANSSLLYDGRDNLSNVVLKQDACYLMSPWDCHLSLFTLGLFVYICALASRHP